MEENPSGSLPSTSPTRAAARADQPWTGPTPHDDVDPRLLSDETVRMARVLPLSAVGVTNDQPPGDGPRACPGGPFDCTCFPGTPVGRVRVLEEEHGVRGVPLEEGTLLEVAGTDPFVLWCRRVLYASGVIAWLLLLVPIVRIVWSELWF